ncbi:MAG: ATP-binding protein [Alphaproteobacteria bacterium]
MNNNSLFSVLLEEFHDKIKDFPEGIIRERTFPNIPNKIMVAIGMRRTGKTHLLLQTIKTLLKEIPLTRILYINFEDDRLSGLSQQQLAGLLDDFYSFYPENHDALCYLFLDEIQNVDNWHQVVRRYFDTKKVKIYLTGSSAKLLSKEIASSLRGRSFAVEVWPFNYKEFLEKKNLSFPSGILGKKALDQSKKNLTTYLEQGGLPEVISLEHQEDRTKILQDYVSTVIFRDIVERYNITNLHLIRQLIKIILKNIGCLVSVNKLFEDLKSQGISVSKGTLHEYFEYINDSYLAFTVPLYAESLRKVQSNPRKIYAVDTGLSKAYSVTLMSNFGHHFENLVYLDLRRRGDEIYYYLTKKNRREVDFFTCDLMGKWHLYQVSWDISDPETLARETLALREAEEELNLKGHIITPESYFSEFLPSLQRL